MYTVFCSVTCAVEQAIKSVGHPASKVCLEHLEWRDCQGLCPMCEERYRAAKNLSTKPANVDQAEAKGVENVQ
jgi:hypothetical protein